MRALSIKQPWAWLICKGIKDVVNRNWYIRMPPLLNYPPMPRHIYIHAGLSRSEISKDTMATILRRLTGREAADFMTAYQFHLRYGAIIGEVDIVGCRYRFAHYAEENAKPYSAWHEVGMYGLLLANPVIYAEPIPCKGKLSFFEPDIQ